MEKSVVAIKQWLESWWSKISWLTSVFSRIKKEYVLMILATFMAKELEAQWSSFVDKEETVQVNDVRWSSDTLV